MIAERNSDCKAAVPELESAGALLYQYPDASTFQLWDRRLAVGIPLSDHPQEQIGYRTRSLRLALKTLELVLCFRITPEGEQRNTQVLLCWDKRGVHFQARIEVASSGFKLSPHAVGRARSVQQDFVLGRDFKSLFESIDRLVDVPTPDQCKPCFVWSFAFSRVCLLYTS